MLAGPGTPGTRSEHALGSDASVPVSGRATPQRPAGREGETDAVPGPVSPTRTEQSASARGPASASALASGHPSARVAGYESDASDSDGLP
jgi:hypothetical protein